jgi:molecular chaperone GrpE
MTDPIDDEALLSRFRDWLRDARLEAEGLNGDLVDVDPSTGAEPDVGLYRLVEEFTALRHELKLETKGARGLNEQVDALLPTLRQAIEQFRSVAPKEEQAAQLAGRSLAEAVADLDEALARGRLEIEKARARSDAENAAFAASVATDLHTHFRGHSWFRRFRLRSYHEQVRDLVARRLVEPRAGFFDALLEGYGLIQDRLRKAMAAGQVRRIECVGLAVDPTLMSVLEMVDTTDQPPGHVVDEVRRGYTWRGRLLRYAEVRAARGRAIEEEEAKEEEVEEEDEDEEPEHEVD